MSPGAHGPRASRTGAGAGVEDITRQGTAPARTRVAPGLHTPLTVDRYG